MVDSNLQQRETILPSERAWAYRMKMEALNHNGIKDGKHSCDIVTEQTGESKAQIFRYIRLTELVEKLLDMVDAKQLALTPAVKLSYLPFDEQLVVVECMVKHEVKPSLSQTVRLKKLHQSGELTPEMIDEILSEIKKPTVNEPKASDQYRQFFPPDFSAEQMEEIITSLLKEWQSGRHKAEGRATA